ncbi:MAG: Tab2 family RNA-binding protein [Cyanobacteriota bacterium]|nr:Tab2 family RNA-binding protein [Cyanobacteriota bacterium]
MTTTELRLGPDWEVDFYSRPILEAGGRKRWELLVCTTPTGEGPGFRWACPCPADSVNSIWLRESLAEALKAAADDGYGPPRRLRCWRASMRAMVQRAAEALGLDLVASRRCYALVDWLQQREREVYPTQEGYLSGPLAPPPQPVLPPARPLPEAARGDRWSWAHLSVADLAEAAAWDVGFAALVPCPPAAAPAAAVPGIRLFSGSRALAIAGWLAGLEPVRLEVRDRQLVLEAGLDDRWLLASLPADEAEAAASALAEARRQAGGLQFLAVQTDEAATRFDGFWILRDLPDG